MGKYTQLAPIVEQGTIKVEGGACNGLKLEIHKREADYSPDNHYQEWGKNGYGKGRGSKEEGERRNVKSIETYARSVAFKPVHTTSSENPCLESLLQVVVLASSTPDPSVKNTAQSETAILQDQGGGGRG